MDFLGTGTSSNNNQTNSYVLRQRQIWGKAALKGGFAVTGGQMWSLVTEDRKGTDNRTEILPNTIDPQYMVGYSWTRQPGYPHSAALWRLQDRRVHHRCFGGAGADHRLHGFEHHSPTDFFFAGIGQNGGLYNAAGNIGNGNTAGTGGITTYANNVAPDVIVKAAYRLPELPR